MNIGDYVTNFYPSSEWQKISLNLYLTTPMTPTVSITTKMECHPCYHSCHQSQRAAAYLASSPPNDCSSAARRRAVPRPTYPSLYQKVVRLIRRSIHLQPPSQHRTISPPPPWEALNLPHHRHKQTYPHQHLQTLTRTNPLCTNVPIAINNLPVVAAEPFIPTPKTHKVTRHQPLPSPLNGIATAATPHLPQAASGISHTGQPNNSRSSNSHSKCRTSHPPGTTISISLKNSASAWKIRARGSFQQL